MAPGISYTGVKKKEIQLSISQKKDARIIRKEKKMLLILSTLVPTCITNLTYNSSDPNLSSYRVTPDHPGWKRRHNSTHQFLFSEESSEALNRAPGLSTSSEETSVAAILRTKAEEHL